MEERPTCGVYIEILTCRAIFYHLEESRSHRNEWEAERAGGRAPALPPWAPTLVQAPIAEWSTPSQRSRRADRNAYIFCYIWSSESRDINKRTPHKRAGGLIGPKLDFGP